MHIRVVLFGGLRQIAGRRETDLDVGGDCCVSSAVERLGLPLEAVGMAVVNGEVAPLDAALADGDELALFSPIGGG
jgi:molybdopterin converting factor small subunit